MAHDGRSKKAKEKSVGQASMLHKDVFFHRLISRWRNNPYGTRNWHLQKVHKRILTCFTRTHPFWRVLFLRRRAHWLRFMVSMSRRLAWECKGFKGDSKGIPGGFMGDSRGIQADLRGFHLSGMCFSVGFGGIQMRPLTLFIILKKGNCFRSSLFALPARLV